MAAAILAPAPAAAAAAAACARPFSRVPLAATFTGVSSGADRTRSYLAAATAETFLAFCRRRSAPDTSRLFVSPRYWLSVRPAAWATCVWKRASSTRPSAARYLRRRPGSKSTDRALGGRRDNDAWLSIWARSAARCVWYSVLCMPPVGSSVSFLCFQRIPVVLGSLSLISAKSVVAIPALCSCMLFSKICSLETMSPHSSRPFALLSPSPTVEPPPSVLSASGSDAWLSLPAAEV
mmetsp:Transcript_20398/g.38005  ORF Transcript_20398/g.38005 Transcript_20398/m.38005 type:complete len:236 (+) Transcript_20398:233-940(+)